MSQTVENVNQTPLEARLRVHDYWRVIKERKAVVLAVFLLVFCTAATVTYFQPKIFQATARIKVEQDPGSLAKLGKVLPTVKKPLASNNRVGYRCQHESALPETQDTLQV